MFSSISCLLTFFEDFKCCSTTREGEAAPSRPCPPERMEALVKALRSPRSEDEEDDQEDLEHDQELEDNIEAEIHMNDMKADHLPGGPGVVSGGSLGGLGGQVQQRDQQQQATSSSVMSKQGQGPSASDLIVSYTAFQAEATAAVPGGRSGMLLYFKFALLIFQNTRRLA